VVISILLFSSNPNPIFADFPFSTDEINKYLIIASGSVNGDGTMMNDVGQAENTNNFELGANKAPVPSTSDFLNSGGGPGLAGNVPNLPGNAAPVFSGIGFDGNIAIISPGGVFNFQDVGVFADPNIGIRTAQSVSSADAGTSNSFFNDPNQFPNTFDGVTGVQINPNDAVQSTRIDKTNSAGVTGNVDFTSLLAELFGPAGAKMTIPALASTGTLIAADGKIETDTTYILDSGLNVIDIVTGGGKDFLLSNANLVINGPSDAFAIFRVPDDANFIISQANILIGNGGIGLNNVVFFSDKADNNSHYNFDNTIINGIAFWSLSMQGGEININNSQGCTQLIADKVNLNDVRFNRCAPNGNGMMVGGVLLDIDTTAVLLAAIGTDPLITGLVALTMVGIAGQAAWFIHRRKKKIEITTREITLYNNYVNYKLLF